MTKEMQTLTLVPQGSLEAYVRAANTYPMLTAEEEKELGERLHYEGDLDAAKQLILSHLRFVVHVARNYAGYGLPQADLIQEGNIGLMKAVRRFNPEMGVRLVSFAVHWIKAEIHEYVLRNWRIVKVATTKAQRKLFFNLRKTKQRLGWFNQDEVELVARELGVSEKTCWKWNRVWPRRTWLLTCLTTTMTAHLLRQCYSFRINLLISLTISKMTTGIATPPTS